MSCTEAYYSKLFVCVRAKFYPTNQESRKGLLEGWKKNVCVSGQA
jgi:hypothetical protein